MNTLKEELDALYEKGIKEKDWDGWDESSASAWPSIRERLLAGKGLAEKAAGWRETFRAFYDDNLPGGSSRWKVGPFVVEVFIASLLKEEAVSSPCPGPHCSKTPVGKCEACWKQDNPK